jgi:hypothetical protein
MVLIPSILDTVRWSIEFTPAALLLLIHRDPLSWVAVHLPLRLHYLDLVFQK